MSNYATVPLNIFQTYHTLHLPEQMRVCVNKLKQNNPEFTHHLYDDTMCREFIKRNFQDKVVRAFDMLNPGAYKADLWRYCVLYIHGGIYLDIKYGCVGDFKLIELTKKEHYVKDQILAGVRGVYQACMIHFPKSEVLIQCIDQVVTNVQNRYYGTNALMITGPHMMRAFVSDDIFDKSELHLNENKRCIYYNDRPILRVYTGYRTELQQTQTLPPYYVLWEKRKVYGPIKLMQLT
jgi:mannosyltransferase OCH1-like enzyme